NPAATAQSATTTFAQHDIPTASTVTHPEVIIGSLAAAKGQLTLSFNAQQVRTTRLILRQHLNLGAFNTCHTGPTIPYDPQHLPAPPPPPRRLPSPPCPHRYHPRRFRRRPRRRPGRLRRLPAPHPLI